MLIEVQQLCKSKGLGLFRKMYRSILNLPDNYNLEILEKAFIKKISLINKMNLSEGSRSMLVNQLYQYYTHAKNDYYNR